MKGRTAAPQEIAQAHLLTELHRLDARLQRAVERWRLAGQDPDDAFRGLYIPDDEVQALLDRPLGSNWGATATLPQEIDQQLKGQAARARQWAEAIARNAEDAGIILPLEHLRATFRLSPFELDTLLICVAPSIDLRYQRIYAYLQDDVTKKHPTVNLVLDLLSDDDEVGADPEEDTAGPNRLTLLSRFSEDAPLLRNGLVELRCPSDTGQAPRLAHEIHLDEGLASWLLGMGGYLPHPDVADWVSLHHYDPEAQSSLVEEEIRDALSFGAPGSTHPPLFFFYGPDDTAQDAAAGWLAGSRHRPLLVLDLATTPQADASQVAAEQAADLRRKVRLVLRDARLTGAIPMLKGWDQHLANGAAPLWLLKELYDFPGTIIVTGRMRWHPKGLDRQRRVIQLNFPVPAYQRRLELWRHFIGEALPAAEMDLGTLAGQFSLTTGQIRDAVATARDYGSSMSPGDGASLTLADLFAAARDHSNPRLATLAHKITPRYDWDDIILPEDQLALLHELIDTVRGRPQVLDAWGLDRKLTSSRGVTVLFSGPPGTGKTMAAEIIAAALGLDLYKIDLSTIVSKYIGETEKNIERIFREAEQSNAILFFDEADALFGKRSEVRDSHDRYANIEISYLLQRMEAYDGVTILATNLRGNLDEAFTRRLQFAVNFPFPEAEDRLRIWHTLFPDSVPSSPDIDFNYLAEHFRLAGGNIRNIILSAAYLAVADGQHITMAHLLHGTRRELQKMGRLVREEDYDLTRIDE
ncbi:MAG: ATP-binding protein [Anaerolineae bacterium]